MKRTAQGTLVTWHAHRAGPDVTIYALEQLRAKGVPISRVVYLTQSVRDPHPPRDSLGGAVLETIVVGLSDPTRHREIRDALSRDLLPRLKELPGPVHINVSPGTPAMHAVWLLLFAGGAFPEGSRLWSSQLVPANNKRRLDEVDFEINTYLAEVRRAARREPERAQYDPASRSQARRDALAHLRRCARLPHAPLLVLGERGTGKSRLVETWIGPLKGRAPVVAVACGTLEPTLAMSELFGHVKGAFTGADRDRVGCIGAATGGVLFLDEVQDLPPTVQRQLVRFLQDPHGLYRRVGENTERKADADVVCASHLSITELRERLDADLFDRLSLLVVELPALRACRDDLRDDWQRVWTELRGTTDLPDSAPWTPAIERSLLCDPLPGNLRDLQRLALLVAAHVNDDVAVDRASQAALEEWTKFRSRFEAPLALGEDSGADGSWDAQIERLRTRMARDGIARHGTAVAAARALSVNERTLRRYADSNGRSKHR